MAARARTGSGKTVAYVLPIIQSILREKSVSGKKSIRCLILVPSRELADQVQKLLETFSSNCGKDVRSVNVSQHLSGDVVRSLLSDQPDIVIATPARACQSLKKGSLHLQDVTQLVIDEADLLLSYGLKADLDVISNALPNSAQSFMMSATLTPEVDDISRTFCTDPAVLDLKDKDDDKSDLSQYFVRCPEDDKFLLAYVIFKLRLITGKCIIFVNDVDRSYRLKLFLDQFGIKSCVLNAELPVNSRLHVVQDFNRGRYQNIIATDNQEVLSGVGGPAPQDEDDQERESDEGPQQKKGKKAQTKKRKGSSKEKDYGVSRGIDFQDVKCVLNFDLPSSSRSYTHRVGRTARAGKGGMALSFVIPAEHFGKDKATHTPSAKHDEATIKRIIERQKERGHEVKPYSFDMEQVEAFRYRMTDALRAASHNAVRQARTRELREELVKSEKLRSHFEANPNDLRHLRHDGEMKAARVQPHLKHIPDYLIDSSIEAQTALKEGGSTILPTGNRKKRDRSRKSGQRQGKSTGSTTKKLDPLKSFSVKGKPPSAS